DNELSKRIGRRLEKISEIYFGIVLSLEKFLSGDIKSAYDIFDSTFSDNATFRYIHHYPRHLIRYATNPSLFFASENPTHLLKIEKRCFIFLSLCGI
ncbi:TPA: hypothetical protein ACJVTI_003971, partial [Salmonella enterica subsp. enterica serovar Oranienburg]